MSNSFILTIFQKLINDKKLKTEVKTWFLMFMCNDPILDTYRDNIRFVFQRSEMDRFLERHGVTDVADVPPCLCLMCGIVVYDDISRVLRLCSGCTRDQGSVDHTMKMSFWRNHHGNATSAPCMCCGTTIREYNFSAAHVIARVYGGLAELDNIVPTCHSCNAAMGSTDLRVYTAELGRIRVMLARFPVLLCRVEVRWELLSIAVQCSLSG